MHDRDTEAPGAGGEPDPSEPESFEPEAPGRDLARRARGRWGEDLAARHYRRAGFDVIDRNWRCRHGEIDLVARRGRLLVFCEVKARRTAAYGGPRSAVDAHKQHRLRRLAAAWLASHDVRGVDVRFDVAAITGVRLELIESAF